MFNKIFSKATPAVTRWREVEQQNASDLRAAQHWMVETDPSAELLPVLQKLSADPFAFEIGDQFIVKAARFESEKPFRMRLAQAAVPMIEHRIAERTRPAAKAVFESVLERLRAELASVENDDARRAAKYDLPIAPSSTHTALADEIKRIESLSQSVDRARVEDIRSWINSVL